VNVLDFDFPVITDNEMYLGSMAADPQLLEEAKARGFYSGRTEWNDLFSNLFFYGGSLNFKDDIPEVKLTRISRYLRSFMGSFTPSHEDKEAVSALLLSEICASSEVAS